MTRRRVRKFVAGGVLALAVAGVLGPATPNAGAACLSAEAYTFKTGSATRHYAVGPKKCVVNTPFSEGLYLYYERQSNTGPAGTPSGAGVGVWIPTP